MRKAIKTYDENGIRYQFNATSLMMQINQRKYNLQMTGEKATKSQIMEELADMLFVSVEAIKSWMYGYNGPSEIEQIKSLGGFFGIDYHKLLSKEEEEMKENTSAMNTIITDDYQARRTKDCVREIYNQIFGYIDLCEYHTNELYKCEMIVDEIEDGTTVYREAAYKAKKELLDCFEKVLRTVRASLLDIPADFYDKLEEYLWTDLNDYGDQVTHIPTDEEWEKKLEPLSEEEIRELRSYKPEFVEPVKEYYNTEYMDRLRELFADFIVK